MVSIPNRAARLPAAEPVPVNAPLFRRLVDSLSDEKRCVVLDLGPPRAETVALLNAEFAKASKWGEANRGEIVKSLHESTNVEVEALQLVAWKLERLESPLGSSRHLLNDLRRMRILLAGERSIEISLPDGEGNLVMDSARGWVGNNTPPTPLASSLLVEPPTMLVLVQPLQTHPITTP